MPKKITILGSTGSIGKSTLSLIRDSEPGRFSIGCLTANTNVDALAKQALEFSPKKVVIRDKTKESRLKDHLSGTGIEIASGEDALIEAGAYPSDFVMAAIVGAAGLKPTFTAVKTGTHVGLANKECLVCAGDVFMEAVEHNQAQLLPVDSEHNAIFQVLEKRRPHEVKSLILTASGGPFLHHKKSELAQMTRAQALSHPVWKMGAKISIDSATLMNKGLELIEAHYLFQRPSAQIDIVIHPQSIIHSMVSYIDGSVLAQLGSPDMRTPIAYALAWPERMAADVEPLDLAKIGKLQFFAPDTDKFQALSLARQALEQGGQAPCALNAANEVAVAAFLEERIGFLDIPACIEYVMNTMAGEAGFLSRPAHINEVMDIDRRGREIAHIWIQKQG